MKIRSKILFFVLTTSLLVFTAAIGYVSFNYKSMSLDDAKKIAESSSLQSSYLVKSILNVDFGITRTLKQAFAGYSKFNPKQRKIYYDDILTNVLVSNPDFKSVWASWELSALDSTWEKPYGRVRTAMYIRNGSIEVKEDTIDTEGEVIGGLFHKIKTSDEMEFITEPYPFSYVAGDTVLESSIVSKLMKDNKMAAITGIDITLDRFQNIINKITPFKKSYVFIVSNQGLIIAHPKKSFIRTSITTSYNKINTKYRLLDKIEKGESFSVLLDSLMQDTTTYLAFTPISIGNTKTPWSIGIVIPLNVIMENADYNFKVSIFVGIIGLIILSIIILIISHNITSPLKRTTEILQELDKGMINQSKKLETSSKDEIGDMARSVNNLIDSLTNMADFAKNIGQGDLTAEYSVLSEFDILGNALLEMRKNLIIAKEEDEKRKIEVEKNSWAQDGITLIGEIIRQNYETVEEFSYNIISALVKFLKANQGGFYLLNDSNTEDIHIELKAAFAYDRKKMLDTKIYIGENLVGRCFQEKKIITINNLPEGYMYITSGLGEKTPTHLLLSPMVSDNEAFGVIEIASFYKFEPHEISFMERVSERIASSVSNIKKNTRTSALLKQSQKQSIELAEHEREMRQHLSELQEARDEALRRELETSGILEAISSTAAVVYYDMKGTITHINDKNLDELGFTREDIIGKNNKDFSNDAKENPEHYQKFWDDLRSGKTRKRIFYIKIGDVERWLSETYTPILNKNGKPYKVVNIGIDITENKILEKKIKELKEDIQALELLR